MTRRAARGLAAGLVLLAATGAFAADEAAAGASWKTAADARIEEIRKADFAVLVVDEGGAPAEGVSVAVEQIRSAFPFGGAITGRLLENADYQAFVREHFDWAVFGNESKWYANEARGRGQVTYETADALLDWCEKSGLTVRGHTIFWAPERWQPRWVQALEGEELRSAVEARLESAVRHFRGRFVHWDVNNEMLHGSFFEDRLGEGIRTWMFQRAHELDPEVRLFTNEFNILSVDQNFEAVETGDYVRQVQGLIEGGAPIHGVGVQGHVWFEDTLDRPELLKERLDELATLGLPIWISEFDSAFDDPELNADVLELVYRTGFSHPAVEGIVAWVVWAGDSWRGPNAGFAKQDWTLSEAGRRYEALREEWSTRATGATDEGGRFAARGFHGEYRVTLRPPGGGGSVVRTLQVGPGKPAALRVVVAREEK
jgi:GH35 family endo-1,4-beta-xylanase